MYVITWLDAQGVEHHATSTVARLPADLASLRSSDDTRRVTVVLPAHGDRAAIVVIDKERQHAAR
jgi:hypothetical protein